MLNLVRCYIIPRELWKLGPRTKTNRPVLSIPRHITLPLTHLSVIKYIVHNSTHDPALGFLACVLHAEVGCTSTLASPKVIPQASIPEHVMKGSMIS